MLPGKLLNFKLNGAVCNAISTQNFCIYCLQVSRSFGFICCSYTSVTRAFCSKQIYCDRQRKWYKTHCCMVPEKLVNIWWNIWFSLLLNTFGIAFLVDFDACFPNYGLDWPAVVLLYSARAFFWSEKSFLCAVLNFKKICVSRIQRKSPANFTLVKIWGDTKRFWVALPPNAPVTTGVHASLHVSILS